MDAARRILAAYLVLTAAAVAINLMFTPVYHDGSPEYPIWKVVNYFMAVGVFVSLVVSFLRRRWLASRDAGQRASTLDYVRVGVTWYGAIVLTMLFFWEWFWTLNPASETGDAVTSHLIYFPIVNSLFVAVALSTGRYLWNDGGGSRA